MSLQEFQKGMAFYDVPTLGYSGSTPTGLIDPRTGLPLAPVAEFTWAQILTKTPADLGNIFFRVTDKHSNTNGAGGSTWFSDTVNNKFSLVSGPLVTTWAARPAANLAYIGSGLRCYFTDIGIDGSEWRSNGTRYKLTGSKSCYIGMAEDVAISSSTNVTITASVPIITDATKSCWQNGDRLRFFSQADKTGTTNNLNRRFLMGSVNTNAATLLQSVAPGVTNIAISDTVDIKRISATSVRLVGQTSSSYRLTGNATTTWQADITGLDNIDTSAAYYLNFALALVGGTADTNVTQRDMLCELITCGA